MEGFRLGTGEERSGLGLRAEREKGWRRRICLVLKFIILVMCFSHDKGNLSVSYCASGDSNSQFHNKLYIKVITNSNLGPRLTSFLNLLITPYLLSFVTKEDHE